MITSEHPRRPVSPTVLVPDLPETVTSDAEAANAPLPTLADVLAILAGSTTLVEHHCKQWAAAIGTLARLLDRSPDSLPASLPALRPLMATLTPTVTRLSAKTLANTKSLVKAALTRLGLHRRVRADGAPIAPAWEALYRQLPDKRFRNGLSRFIHYASRHRVEPNDVDQPLFERFITDLEASGEVAHVGRRHRETALLWNRAARTQSGWPTTLLVEASVDRPQKHLPWEAFPLEFQDDVDLYLQWLGGSDFLAEDAPVKACKPSTVKVRREQLRIAASSLAASGVPVEEITGLRCLVDPVKARVLLTHMVEANAGVKSTYVRGVATTLVALARWCKVEPMDLDEIKRLRSRLGGVPSGLTQKNKTLLRKFEDQRILDALLALPSKLAAEARRSQLSPGRRAQRMQVALFLELLLNIPLRLQNLSELEWGKQLLRPGGPTKPMQLVFNSEEVKNELSMTFDIPVTVQTLLDEYWQHFRPLLVRGDSNFLFITLGGAVKSADSLRDGVTKAVKRHVGIHMTPHQFRHLAAKLMLDANPGAYLLVQHFLGHKNIKTTINFYAESQSRNAGRALDGVVAKRRAGAKDD